MIKLKLIAGVDGVRIRETPVEGRPVGQVYIGEVLESRESDAETRRKVGVEEQWLQVSAPSGRNGYIAAWLITYAEEADAVERPSGEEVTEQIPGSRISSMLAEARAGADAAEESPVTDQDNVPTVEIPGHKEPVADDAPVVDEPTPETPTRDENAENEAPVAEDVRTRPDDTRTTISIAIAGSDGPLIPATALEVDGVLRILVQPTVDVLRLRDAPVVGVAVGTVNAGTPLIALDSPEVTRHKIGVKDEWLHVRTFDSGQTGYVAAWLVAPYTGPIPETASYMDSLNIVGMNLDVLHPLGAPDAQRLKGLGWVRLGYNVSAAKGSEDIQAAYDRYMPYIEDYARARIKVLLCFTHQTYGEGKNEYWPWPDMTTAKWKHLSERFADMVGRIAKQYAGQDLVHAYQIWNEMDAPIGAVASVPMIAQHYAIILSQTIPAIRAVDASVPVITGGHSSGPGKGSQYARDTLTALPGGVRPDGIAFHPYGRGTPPNDPYANFGHIDDSMKAYQTVLPGKPVWITEWGILDCTHHDPADILNYASKLVKYLKNRYAGQVAALIWYAWAMSMHNGYGLVGTDNQPIQPLNDGFRQL